MKKSAFIFLFLLSLSAAMFAGGGNDQRSDNNVSVWYWDDLVTQDYHKIVREFEQANPGTKVHLSVTPFLNYWTKLQTALPAGADSDIFWLNHPNAASFLPSGHVMDLEPWADSINFSNFDERFTLPYTYQGRRYAVPFMWDSVVLFYNKAHFDKAGISYPDENWTWADYILAAQYLTIRDGNAVIQYGTIVTSSMQGGIGPLVYQAGGSVYNSDRTKLTMNTPEAREAVQREIDLISGGFAPTMQELAETGALNLFVSGAASMIPQLSIRIGFFAEALGDDLRVAPLPQHRRRATIFHNVSYAAAARTSNIESTMQLMKFLAGSRASEIVSNTFAPSFNGMAESYFEKYNWAGAGFIPETINYGFPLPIASRNAGALWIPVEDELSRILTNLGPIGNQLTDLEAMINAEIAR